MTYYARSDETSEWLNYLQPEGLVVGPNVLRDKGLTPIRQTPLDTDEVAEVLGLKPEDSRDDDKHYVLRHPWVFFEKILQWPASFVAGSPDGSDFPEGLDRVVPEHETGLSPDMAVLWRDNALEGVPAQLLVALHPELDPDQRDQFGPSAWEASPHQRLERLLRETGVGAGILIARNTLRLVYAPRGETAGWMSWPLAALGRVEGRPMLAGLKLCLGRAALFTGAPEARLRTILKDSRESQNEVSEKLSVQVLGALHEMLRGLYAAAPTRIEALADSNPHHLYEGLLTCLMRLVFLLYAEDRDLLPSSPDPQLKALWEGAYSIKTLYARLLTDEALNPDTMDARRGAWGQLLAVFRIIHDGHGAGWVARRGGKLFDPNAFSFLEGRDLGSSRSDATVLPISDGCILRILHGLMTVEARGLNGEKIRERLSYRSLDVESIGSVYETVMGFTTHRALEPMIALKDDKKLPTFVGIETLLNQKPAVRQKWLKESAISLSAKQLTGVKTAETQAELLEAFGSAIDDRASPGGHPIGAGAPYLQPTEERRRSGSHYTPRSLTEPIVRHALEPAFERIGADAAPEAVLELKVLDPACGSGAFLVEACRQLGARLEQAWDMHKAEKPEIPSDEDEAIHARRLVAQRCIYGVDRNPMAVDLARLSLWLATLAREHEFSFLDHALKSGDSLVGLTQREITAAHWDASKPGVPLLSDAVKERVGKALQGREAIRNAPDSATLDQQSARHGRVEVELETARLVGDAVIAAFFSSDKPKERETARAGVESEIIAYGSPQWDKLKARATAFRLDHGWRPFHWEIEFPEVFARDNPGFDAIVGNPPFAGKNTISAASGPLYVDETPFALMANSGRSFQGSILLGKGFVFDDKAAKKGESESIDRMNALKASNPANNTCIFPLIGGEEVTTSPTHKAKRSLLEEFRLHVIPKNPDPVLFIDDVLGPFAAALDDVRSASFVATKHAETVNSYIGWLNRIDNSDWIPPAMLFLTKYRNKPALVARFFQLLERLAAFMHISRYNVNGRIETYGELLAEIESGIDPNDSPILHFDEEYTEIFCNALDGDIYRLTPRRRNYLLLRLDSFMSDGAATYDPRILTVEHVLPQTVNPDTQWEEWWPQKEHREQWVHRLANLVPLNKKKNSAAQNYSFDDKCKIYFSGTKNISSYALTSQVISEEAWTPEIVEARQESLIAVLMEGWELAQD